MAQLRDALRDKNTKIFNAGYPYQTMGTMSSRITQYYNKGTCGSIQCSRDRGDHDLQLSSESESDDVSSHEEEEGSLRYSGSGAVSSQRPLLSIGIEEPHNCVL